MTYAASFNRNGGLVSGKNSDVTTHARPSCSAEYALPSQLSLLGHEPNWSHEPACAEFALPHQHLMLSQELNRNGQNRSCARVSLTSSRAECALPFQRLLLGLEPKWSHERARAELALPQQRLLLSQDHDRNGDSARIFQTAARAEFVLPSGHIRCNSNATQMEVPLLQPLPPQCAHPGLFMGLLVCAATTAVDGAS